MAQMAEIKSNHVWWKYALFHNFRDLDRWNNCLQLFHSCFESPFRPFGPFWRTWGNSEENAARTQKPRNSSKISMKHKGPIVSNSEQVPKPNLQACCHHTKLLLYFFSKWYSKKGRKQNLIKGWGSLFIWKKIFWTKLFIWSVAVSVDSLFICSAASISVLETNWWCEVRNRDNRTGSLIRQMTPLLFATPIPSDNNKMLWNGTIYKSHITVAH